tara:strand:- start:498 stop:1373 length:876 start_codon:yes stop_codon:yes gene_type:complete
MSSKNDTPDINNPRLTLVLDNEVSNSNNQQLPLILNNEKPDTSSSELPLILEKEFSVKTSIDSSYLKKEIKDIKNESSKIIHNIKNKEDNLKKLYAEKTELDKNIENFKKNQNEIRSEIVIEEIKLLQKKQYDREKQLKESNSLITEYNQKIFNLEKQNRSFENNNNELKKSLDNYINKYKEFQNKIDVINNSNNKKLNELNQKIKFYQDENIRLSSDFVSTKNKYDIIKKNFTDVEDEKNQIYNQIQELNDSLNKTNVVGTSFANEIVNEELKNLEPSDELNEEINNIFK